MNGIFSIIGVCAILILMFNKKAKIFVKKNKDLVLCILYLYMFIWFSYILLRINNFKLILKYMKKNPMYVLYLII